MESGTMRLHITHKESTAKEAMSMRVSRNDI